MSDPRTFTAAAVAALPGAPWLRQAREAAFERFSGADRPTSAEEVWRYSRIDDFDLDRYALTASGPAGADTGVGTALPDDLAASVERWLDAAGPRSGVVVTYNGRVVRAELEAALAGQGVIAGALAGEAEAPESWSDEAPDAYVEWATAFTVDGVVIRVPRRVVAGAPIVVINTYDGAGAAVAAATHVVTGEAAEATVVEFSISSDQDLMVAPVTRLAAGAGSHLSYLNIQDLGHQVWQLGYQSSRTGRDATLRSFSVALGGHYARLRTDARLEGAGGTSNLLAAYFGVGEQTHDFRTMQDHVAPKTTSDLLFKGALRDAAQSVYTGLIRVRRGAAGTNAFQTNRNLVLSERAHAYSVPNLEIDENDVSCSHASAVGPIDEEQRYYLESRGVPSDAAGRLIVLGFFDDILDRSPDRVVTRALRPVIASRLQGIRVA